ncbi:hypothetical protein EKO04_002716 [Ascochyta lentis]|uniref:Uncharacterized protein n=1 Tax=Ascochyta lentis TaxID=205686 RepID=A0A8H7J6G2_9PLEO|nr:hypothetical protein EKO04_002716 [Ascochyta lentis]
MPWIPEGARPDLLAAIPASQWNAWADGAPIGTAPHRQLRTVWEMRLNRSFVSLGGIAYTTGMKGQLQEVDEDKQMAKIYIQGVTDRQGSTDQWVPLSYVDKGKAYHGHSIEPAVAQSKVGGH